jgi:hypothetical protein
MVEAGAAALLLVLMVLAGGVALYSGRMDSGEQHGGHVCSSLWCGGDHTSPFNYLTHHPS